MNTEPAEERAAKRSKRRRRWRIFWLSTGLLLLAAVLAFLAGIPLSVAFLNDRLESMASDALGVQVDIRGEIDVTTGLKPTVKVGEVVIGDHVDQPLASISGGRAQFELLPLFGQELRLVTLSLNGLYLDLAQPWPRPQSQPAESTSAPGFVLYLPLNAEVLGADLRLPAVGDQPATLLHLDSLQTEHAIGRKLALQTEGTWLDYPLRLAIDADPLWRVPADLANYRLTMDGEALATQLQVDALFGFGQEAGASHFQVQISGEDATPLAQLTGVPAYRVDDFNIQGGIGLQPGEINLDGMRIDVPPLRGEIDLTLKTDREQLVVGGQAAISYLDLERVLELIQIERDIDATAPDLKLTGGIRLDASGIENAPLELHAVSADVALQDEFFQATLHSVRAADTVWNGEAFLDSSGACPLLDLKLHGEQFHPSHFLPERESALQWAGAIGDLNLATAFCLDNPFNPALPPSLAASAGSGELQISDESNSLVFMVNNLQLESSEERVTLGVDIEFDRLAVRAQGRTIPVAALLSEDTWPLQLNGQLNRAQFELEGNLQNVRGNPSLAGSVAFSGITSEPGDLLHLDDEMTAEFDVSDHHLDLSGLIISLGDSDLRGSIKGRTTDEGRFIEIDVQADVINRRDVQRLAEGFEQETAKVEAMEQRLNWLLDELPLFDLVADQTNITARAQVGEIRNAPVPINDVLLTGAIRSDRLDLSQLSLTYDGIALTGSGVATTSSEGDRIEAQLSTRNANIGNYLSRNDITDDLDIFAGRLNLNVMGRGRSLGELIAEAELSAEIENTAVAMRAQGESGVPVEFVIDRAEVSLDKNGAMVVDGFGNLLVWPMDFVLTLPSAQKLLVPDQPLDAQFAFSSEDDHGQLAVHWPAPVDLSQGWMQIELHGERIAILDTDLDPSEPALGPYRLTTRLDFSPQAMSLSELSATVAASDVSGNIDLQLSAARPQLELDLQSQTIRFEDLLDRSDVSGLASGSDNEATYAQRVVDGIMGSWIPAAARDMDIDLRWNAQSIFLSEERLGHGQAQASLRAKALSIGPLRIENESSSATGSFFFGETDNGVELRTDFEIDGLDIGPLIRYRYPEVVGGALVYLSLDAAGAAPSIEGLADSVSGEARLSLWPEQLSSSNIDVWAAPVFLNVLGLIDESESTINCGIATAQVTRGEVTIDDLLVDTTRFQIIGRGSADLVNQTVNIGLAPQAKSAAFFSIETPVRVKGPFNDVSVSVGPLGFAMTMLRLYYNIIYVPMQKLFGKQFPADGRPICLQRLDWLEPENRPAALRDIPVPQPD